MEMSLMTFRLITSLQSTTESFSIAPKTKPMVDLGTT